MIAPDPGPAAPTFPEPTKEAAAELDREFAALDADGRIRRAHQLFGSTLIATTSFGRDSGLLLHHLHRLQVPARVYFINTGFHFPETLEYRDTLISAYRLDLREVGPDPDHRRYADQVANVTTIRDTDACCALNKVGAQARFLGRSDVRATLAGLRRDQGPSRKDTPFVLIQRGKYKICPFADMPATEVDLYLRLWEIPDHPLAKEGYTSVGCSPATCTSKPLAPGDARSGRWAGQEKTECGLHLDFNL